MGEVGMGMGMGVGREGKWRYLRSKRWGRRRLRRRGGEAALLGASDRTGVLGSETLIGVESVEVFCIDPSENRILQADDLGKNF